jgi:hypothetical protein
MSQRKATSESASKPRPTRILVVYGYDEHNKPRGEPEVALARKAAELMKLSVFETDAPKILRKLKKLPLGNVYASGWGFVPNVRRTQFDSLLKIVGAANQDTPESMAPTNLPNSWDAIDVGHLVLGQADSAADGWWPANVEATAGDLLTLQAGDYPEAPPAIRHRLAVALFYTANFIPPEQVGSFATGLPISWATLTTGQLVLAAANEMKPEMEGWWEAEIVKIDGEQLTLRWRDFPRRSKTRRHRTTVALINPVPPQAS